MRAVIKGFEGLGSDEPESYAHAADAYSQPIESGEWDRPAVPFHVVLQSPPAGSEAVRAHWLAAGAEISEFVS